MFSENPFRFLGVLSNSGIKNIQKNLSKIKAYSKIGKHLSLPYELNFLNLKKITRVESSLTDAENKILLDPNKVKSALFWFVEENSIDNIALKNLDLGSFDKAELVWRKVIKEKPISKTNFSAYNNLSTLLLLKSLSDKKNDKFENSSNSIKLIKEGLKLKSELIFSNFIFDFSKLICGNENAVSRQDVLLFLNNSVSSLFDKNFSIAEISKIINQSSNKLSESFNSLLIEEPFSNLNIIIESANTDLGEDASRGCLIGKKLIKDSISDLKLLKEVLGKDNLRFELISDKLANQILQCGILYFNKTSNDQDYLSSYKYAQSISIKDATKERAKVTVAHCKEEAAANVCCSCNINSVDKSNAKELEMYKETSRNWLSNSISYSIMTLKIYYCKECNQKMSDASNRNILIGVGAGVIFMIIFFINDLEGAAIFFGAICGFFIGVLANLFNPSSRDVNQQKIVKDYIKQGFSFSKPGN
jgi:hypothetical protein